MLVMYLSLLDTEEQRDKFEYIYNLYKGMMYNIAFSVAKDHFIAEDIVHETFLNLIRIIDDVRIDSERETGKFLKIITHNQAVDHIRKLDRSQTWNNEALEFKMKGTTSDPESIVIERSSLDRLVSLVSEMDALYRTPLVLRVQGYKISEIANILDAKPQTIKVRLHRARKMLLAELEEKPHGNEK